MNLITHSYTSDPISDSTVRLQFDSCCKACNEPGLIPTGLQYLAGSGSEEHWQFPAPPTKGISEDVEWLLSHPWALLATWQSPNGDLAAATLAAYRRLYRVAADLNCGYALRFWNYLPNINCGDDDGENYKQFSLGRKLAFDELAMNSGEYPAASALGHQQEALVVYALFGAEPGRHFENPEQVSAYCYPRQYGPGSPSFARATLISEAGSQRLYFSGTASVVGHESVCVGDILGQTRVTLDNLRKLFRHVESSLGSGRRVEAQNFKIYLRRPEDLPVVAEQVDAAFPDVDKIFLKADICRAELLLEIDGYCGVSGVV